ncbi:uncharacterized protein LOC142768752 [Rhipicephalus microplus]|uniref:uncharacterized protein LOC142768752 n=1 Tax=Rhipicephalus microplus TaxID=6941 RepID=UPI003F6D4508
MLKLAFSKGASGQGMQKRPILRRHREVSAYFDYCDREIPHRRRSDITRFFDMGYLNNVHHDQTIATIGPDTQASDMVRLERFSWDFAKGAEESRQKIDHYARLYANAFEPDEILPQGT